jgi:hypothetical protein
MRQWEEAHGWRLPELFTGWLRSRHTLQVDCGILRLACSPPATPFADLEELLEWDAPPIRARQLFPIGDEQVLNAGPLCLDMRKKGEPAVVYWDAGEEQVSATVFSSFEALLRGATYAMEHPGTLQDGQALEEFLALDPDGAGGPGAAYWRTFLGSEGPA